MSNQSIEINTQIPLLIQGTPSSLTPFHIFSLKETNSLYTNHFLSSHNQAKIVHSDLLQSQKENNIYAQVIQNANDIYKQISNEDFYKQTFILGTPMTNHIASNDDQIEEVKVPHLNKQNQSPSPISKKKKQNEKKPLNYSQTFKQTLIGNFFQ